MKNRRLSYIFLISFGLLAFLFNTKCYSQSELSFDIFKQEDGLPNNRVHCIFQDHKGWIWMGTSQGLSRFNGYNFKNFIPSSTDSTSLKGNLVRVIKEDRNGNLLIGTETGGLNIFDRNKEIFYRPYNNNPEYSNREFSVNDIIEDNDGSLWLATDYNLLTMDTTGNVKSLKPDVKNGSKNLNGIFVRNIKFDRNGLLWLGTNEGLFTYNRNSNIIKSIELPIPEEENKEVWELYLDDDGSMWIGTYSSGIYIIDTQTKKLKHINLEPSMKRTETVRSISKGNFGLYWIGTRGGLFKYSKTDGVLGHYQHNLQDPRSLSHSSVLCVYHDNKGETWVGTRGGVNLLAKSKQVFHNYTAIPGNNNYLNSSSIYALWMNKDGKLWVGTEDGGINIYNPVTGTYEYLTVNGNPGYRLTNNCIKTYLDDGKGNLWIGTYLGGIDVINLKTRQVTNFSFDASKKGSLIDNRVWDLCLDKNNQIWVATSRGVCRYNNESKTFIHYPQLNSNEQMAWLETDTKGNIWMGSLNEIIIYYPETNSINRYFEHSQAMFEDSQNRIWIATNDKGLALYTALDGAIKYYDETQGLANNQTLCILEDDHNNLWISTSNGLSKFSPATEIFNNYSTKDGLCNNQFCYGAALKTPTGELLFGTVSGFNSFNPDEIEETDNDIPLIFTDLKVFNKSVEIGEGKKPLLTKSISETEKISFNYKQNVFTLEFAALNYINSTNNLYTYKLEGFNTDWNEPSKSRTATYTNLDPGNYTLRIKRVSPGNQQESEELTLAITILPPFWKTNWFLSLIIFMIMSLVYLIIRFFINREKIKSQLVIEKANARKLHEVDMMKLKFFTNISHEIRTPLTLILGPLNKMLQSNETDSNTRENLKLMQRNAQNLDRLISQLLDFRKLQSGNLKLNLTEADIVGFIENIVTSFSGYAEEKNIKLSFNTLSDRLFVAFDPDKIEKIVNNLLSNAFKYTEENGSISVNLSLTFDSDDDDFSDAADEKQYIEINIKDTGKGIPRKNLERVFIRFFQSDEKDASTGAGIGLALVKDLIKIHKGKIFVTSKEGKGTKFTIRIPYDLCAEERLKEDEASESIDTLIEQNDDDVINQTLGNDAKIMLVIEDNADVRQFISSHFNTMYQVYQASDGEEGWDKALEIVPDVIVSDIIMPNMDGYDLCKRLKNDERTSHIPILLLTAMHSKEHELKGLTKGADDYITKPFDISVLQAKVENVLSIRESLKEKYTTTMVLEPTNIMVSSPDEKFLKRVIDVVEENISDSELDIEKFSQKVGISRMQLYRKLQALTNMTVKEFIRHIRLKRATQLLDQQKLNISEIAYEVGFKDLSHFRKCFKREYGMSASDYLAKRNEKHPS